MNLPNKIQIYLTADFLQLDKITRNPMDKYIIFTDANLMANNLINSRINSPKYILNNIH